jgi:hypothetical protein
MLKRSIVLGLSLALSTVAASPEAFAKPKAGAASKSKKSAKRPVLVGAFEGVRADETRRAVIEALNATEAYTVTEAEDLKPSSTKKEFAQMARDLMAEATIVGVISKKMNLTLTVYDKNGKKVGAVEIKGGTRKKLASGIQNELEIAIADPLATAAGAAPAAAEAEPKAKGKAKAKEDPETEPASEEIAEETPSEGEGDAESEDSSEESSEEPSEPTEGGGAGKRPIEAMLLVRGYNRKFNYTDQRTQGLAPYDLPMAPAFVLSGRIYPAAFGTDGAISHVGLMGKYELGLATTTIATTLDPATGVETQTTLKTQVNDLQVGLRTRLPLGDSVELGSFGLWGRQQFLLLGDEVNPLVPDTTYTYLRIGIDARIQLGKFTVDVQVAPRFLTSMKELDLRGVWFPGATGSGFDFGAMLGWNYLSWLDAVAGFELVRYGFDFNGIPDDNAIIAGGATDTYLSAFLGARFHLDASASAEDGKVSAETSSDSEDTSSDSEDTSSDE